jgi:hypothetical protein
MRIVKRPSKFLKDLLLWDNAQIVGMESDVGATRIYTATKEQIEGGVVMMHYIRSGEVILTPELRVTLHMEPEPVDEPDEDSEGEEWKSQ